MVKYRHHFSTHYTMVIDKSNNNGSLIKDYELSFRRRDKKKKPRMKVSGGSVKKLVKILYPRT